MLNSLRQLLDNDKTSLSCQAGTAFPTENLLPGMLCFREDEDKLYQLKADGTTWGSVADFTPVNEALALKADTKATTEALALKADKSAVNEALALKADKSAVNEALALKANLVSPTLTGTPKAPTAAAGTNTTQIATTGFVKTAVDAAVSSMLGDAPAAALDTLKELGDALGNDANFAATMTTALAGKLGSGENAVSATKLATARTINGVAFDGTKNITVADATKLPLTGGVLSGTLTISHADGNYVVGNNGGMLRFAAGSYAVANLALDLMPDKSAKFYGNVVAPSFAGALTGNATSATKLAAAQALTIGGVSKNFDGSAAVSWTLEEIGAQATLPAGTNGQVLKHNGTDWVAGTDNNTTYSGMSSAEAIAGTATTNRIINPTILKTAIETHAPAPTAETVISLLPTGTNGQVLKHNGTTWAAGSDSNTTYSAMSAAEANAGTATSNSVITAAVLKGAIETHAPTPTTITGNAGTATKLATARTINGVSFDGTANITVADATKLPLTGGVLSGTLTGKRGIFTGTGNDYNVGGIELTGNGTASILPTLGFHQPGVFAGCLQQVDASTFAFYTQARAAYAGLLTGAHTVSGKLTANDIQSQGWLRSTGNTGWYNETYGGGLYMEDATWIRVYNGKHFLGTEICATGNVTAYYSDRRLKTNLRPIKGALESIASLTGYRYNANKTAAKYGYDPEREEVGLMAQDVQKFAPEVVEQAPFDRTDKKGESKTGKHYLTLKYERLVPHLVEAIKELNAKVNKLEELLEARA